MKRYVLSDLLEDDNGELLFWTTEAEVLARSAPGVHCTQLIPTHPAGHPQEGQPKHAHALVLLGGPDLSAVLDKPKVDALPDAGLDDALVGMEKTKKDKLKNDLQKRGIGINVDAQPKFRDLVREIGKHYEPAFDGTHFDVSE